MKKANICIIAASPLGVHWFIRDHIKALSEFSDVTLLTNPENDTFTPSLENLKVRLVPIGIKRKFSPWADLVVLIKLILYLRGEKFDLVWAVAPKAGLLGMLAARIANIKARLFLFQGEYWASRTGLWRVFLKLMDKVTAIAASHLLAVSESERSFLESNKIVRKGDIKVLGSGSICGVNLERFNFSQDRRDQVRTSLSIPDDSQVLLFAGRLTEDKGLFDLTEAFISTAKTRPNLFWLVVGPDEEKIWSDIVNKLGSLAERCKYVGFSVNMEKYMAASDFICLPSRREGFGMVIIEAAATRIPAIAYDIYGVSNAIDNGVSGLLVEKNNIKKLTETISLLADSSDERKKLGNAALARVREKFDQKIVVQGYVDFIKKILP
jgi:glycosyltransferase involved in cell wall biosynthesis